METRTMQEGWMREAVKMAQNAWGDTHPNPCVGAVIVENGEIVARGWHERSGAPHAEINALRALGRRPAADATLVVTLEPCSTHGRTGACTDAILQAGIRKVVVGATDPFPAHAGRGFEVLRNAGVNVVAGVLAAECEDLNLIFNHCVTHGGATFVALKTASSLDGKIATSWGDSQWITGVESRENVMRWRRYFPAIATSSVTLMRDNPRLTCRISGCEERSPRARFVFDRSLRTLKKAASYHVYNDAFYEQTILVTANDTDPDEMRLIEKIGIRVWAIPCSYRRASRHRGRGRVSDNLYLDFFAGFTKRCAEEGIGGVLVEGGGTFLGAWLDCGEADYLFHYVAPKIFNSDSFSKTAYNGELEPTIDALTTLHDVRHESFGADVLFRGRLNG